ncbi:MAG: hypothetical protein VXZ72_03670, partial [Chlamydiota bacterium]|nr:hypothetical protein [Chlamydiota bacterium]
GCCFKNPSNGPPAGYLIEHCGLKGMREGGVMVSPLHANFIVNEGIGRADDVLRLMERIQQRVYARTGHFLLPEVKLIKEGMEKKEGVAYTLS